MAKTAAWQRKEGQEPRGRPQRSWKAFVAKAGEKYQTPSFGKGSKEKPKESGKT